MRTVATSVVAATLAALAVTVSASGFNFVTLGDWGCMPIGGWHAQDELTVAKQFMKSTADLNARFILNPGDNFYYCGVHNKSDEMWQSTFEDVFTDPSTNVKWWSALGNHDYGYPGSAEAQIEYVSPKADRWQMPNRYYYKRLEFPGEVNISLIVLDASPCQQMYIGNDSSKWDPCGSVIPGCPGCTFHQNVAAQSCAAQLAWLKATLPTIPDGDWKIAMVHAPASEIDVEDLITPLQQSKFDLVVNGHVHLLAHYTVDNVGTYITSGAGCMVKIEDRPRTNKHVPELGATSCPSNPKFHSCQIVFQRTIAGYTTHEFNADFTTLTTKLLDFDGNLLHETTSTKGGQPATPAPGATTPAPSHSCCFYSDSSCSIGQTCCDDEGYSYDRYHCDGSDGQRHMCVWNEWSRKCMVGGNY